MRRDICDITELIGKTLKEIKIIQSPLREDKEDNEIGFLTTDDETYILYHDQDCCEHVRIEDINGDPNDLVGSPILVAEESSNNNHESCDQGDENSETWTFYKIDTAKGGIVIRWYGSSNGYYSEKVTFCKETENDDHYYPEKFFKINEKEEKL